MSEISQHADAFAELDAIVEQGIKEGVFPGAALWVGWRGETVKCAGYGQTADTVYGSYVPVPVTTTTLYDLASLTKPIATTSAVFHLIEQGLLRLDDPISRYIPQFAADEHKALITIQHILTHTSGLPGPCRLHLHYHGAEQILAGLYQQELVFPPGTQCLYNDLGFILLGEAVRVISGMSLDSYTRQYIFEPLGMNDTLFTPPETLKDRIAPTEYVEKRSGLVHGEVHDENAWELGGIAGHAGLFSTVEDLAHFCTMLLHYGGRIFQVSSVEAMVTIHVPDPDEAHGLGWIINAPYFMGNLAGDSTFGHTGFTGTSLLIDPQRQVAIVFLTNCVCPRRGQNLNPSRRGIANVVAKICRNAM